jgi:hypothetical protein
MAKQYMFDFSHFFCNHVYLRDLYLGTYYLYYMFRPIWAIFRYHVYKNVKNIILIIWFCILLRVILTVNNNTFCFATIDKVFY